MPNTISSSSSHLLRFNSIKHNQLVIIHIRINKISSTNRLRTTSTRLLNRNTPLISKKSSKGHTVHKANAILQHSTNEHKDRGTSKDRCNGHGSYVAIRSNSSVFVHFVLQ